MAEVRLDPRLPSYETETGWREYLPYIPEDLRPVGDAAPEEEWWPWRDANLHIDRLCPPDAPLKVLVLHGGGGYGRLLSPFGVAAFRHGYESLAPDLPGYGLTQVAHKRSIVYEDWVECVCDLVEAERQRDGRPLALLGASMGGMLAYEVAARTGAVDGVIATCFLDMRDPAARDGAARNRAMSRVGVPVMSALHAVLDPLPVPMRLAGDMKGIANDPHVSKLASADPLGGGNWMPARFLRTFMNFEPTVEPEEFDACPVLLVHPGDDRWTDIALSRRFFDRLGTEKRMVVLENCGHFPLEEPGMDQMRDATLQFLSALTAGAPAQA